MPQDSEIHRELIKTAKKHHPEIARLIKDNGVLSIEARDEKDLFNFLARTVTGQQLTKAAANTIWDRLIKFSSNKKSTLKKLCIKRNEAKLRACGLSKNKITALIGLHKAFENKEISKQKILKAGYEGITDMVTSLWGFGQWSADITAIFYVHHPDIWPVGDGAIARGVKMYAGDSESSIDISEKYSPYRTYLALHIWKGLDNEKLSNSNSESN